MAHDPSEPAFRAGAASLGMFAGAAVGLLLAWLAGATGLVEAGIARLVFGGGAAGLVCGLFYPRPTMLLVEAVLHFFIGFLAASAGQTLTPSPQSPPWLRLALLFGVSLAAALFVLDFFE